MSKLYKKLFPEKNATIITTESRLNQQSAKKKNRLKTAKNEHQTIDPVNDEFNSNLWGSPLKVQSPFNAQ
jgi:hypothetical protein